MLMSMLTALVALLVSPQLFLPAHTAYLLGGSRSERSEGGSLELKESKSSALWGGHLGTTGDLTFTVKLAAAGNVKPEFVVVGPGTKKVFRDVTGSLKVEKSGWYTFAFSQTGAKVAGLELDGPAAEGAKFNLKTRRNAASVHIGYPQAAGKQVEWFYNEIQAKTDPVHSYYMACGFARGYFGMQVNSESERRVIFSVWDAGNEAVDRKKVDDDNKVKLIAKGDGVFADGFGNEGTGGHSHLVTPWKTNVPQKFLVHAVQDGTGTIYTGYFYSQTKREWILIASFRAPKDGKLLRGLYSFNENFWGDNGNLKRAAMFGPSWIRTTDGQWVPMTTGRFTHDVTGGKDRFDYDLTAQKTKWLLQNGGFEGGSPKLGTLVDVEPSAKPPAIDLANLPKN